ncbi:hypothetical protein Afil01_50170 [Actinorhabdospora filicis]|uniref:HEAT repeat domain-containing protein n=1 Tax=Actinorhabdospora filicis TaxID=1785913 RepID=A0A9W6WCV9_9ACTN|nr:HEAT repeat domain-containing protein [Actinorhabdospora filicis]GLZ80210.1 hypothetical protein Afil01_50170 [Actinorhabdospora filicis]
MPESHLNLVRLLARRQTGSLMPPMAQTLLLPFDQLDPLVFERVVAEVMWLVDRLSEIRVVGRPGQYQGGIDLIGRRDGAHHVYQVRRIHSLSATALRKAVTDFAGPTRRDVPEADWAERPWQAVRFVLAAGCRVEDVTVEEELAKLQQEYAGDLDIALYDAGSLSLALRERPRVVHGIFGPEWGRAFTGVVDEPSGALPNVVGLLYDPVEALGLGTVAERCAELAQEDPRASAELLLALGEELRSAGFPGHADMFATRARERFEQAGAETEAFRIAVTRAVRGLCDGRTEHPDITAVERLTLRLAEPERALGRVITAAGNWGLAGIDVDAVVADLTVAAEAQCDDFELLVMVVAEQIIADEDPRDDQSLMIGPLECAISRAKADVRARLMCCLADLRVQGGVGPEAAFAHVLTEIATGRLPEDFGVLAHLRLGRAHVMSGLARAAIDSYRKGVVIAGRSGYPGDARDALLAIAYLTIMSPETFEEIQATQMAAKALDPHGRRFLPESAGSALTAFSDLKRGAMRGALPAARAWVRKARARGALCDELWGRQTLGEAFEASRSPFGAVLNLVLAGQGDKAVAVVKGEARHLDLIDLLDHPAVAVRAAALKVYAAQADRIPDDQVAVVGEKLLHVLRGEVSHPPFVDDKRAALKAIAALDHRIPMSVGAAALDFAELFIPREDGKSLFIDDAVVALLGACAEADRSESARAGIALVAAWRHDLRGVETALLGLYDPPDVVKTELKNAAGEGSRSALYILAEWNIVPPEAIELLVDLAQGVLDEPVGTARTSYAIGTGVPRFASLLSKAVESGEAPPELLELRDRVVARLMSWAEDRLDTAERREDATSAISVLGAALTDDERRVLTNRLLRLHGSPGEHDLDAFERRSSHPLSGLRVRTNGRLLSVSALAAAAALAVDADALEEIEGWVLQHLDVDADDQEAMRLMAHALAWVSRSRPVPLAAFRSHQSRHIREAAVHCWGHSVEPSVVLARSFAEDKDPWVRLELAHALGRIGMAERQDLLMVLGELERDPSARVRYIAARARESFE